MTTETNIVSNLPIPPGEYLEEVLGELGMSKSELATRMDRPLSKLSAIFKGTKAVTPDTALQLERVTGVPAHIWTGLETDYRLAQAKRYFPLPDYDLTDVSRVRVALYGKVVDPAYTRLLLQNTDLPLSDVLALDRVQKKLPLNEAVAKRLRKAGLIEGRKPNLYIAAKVADAIDSRVDYIRTRKMDDAFYAQLIFDYLDNFEYASRKEIDQLLWVKLSDVLDDEQKTNKINNLLTNLRRAGKIRNVGSRKSPQWQNAE